MNPWDDQNNGRSEHPERDEQRRGYGANFGVGTGGEPRRGRAARIGVSGLGRGDEGAGLSRIFGGGEDPLAWSVAVFRSGSLQVRAHIVVLMVAISELVLASMSDRIGPLHVGLAVGATLLLVLTREIGRWAMVRAMDRDPAPIVLWPLGSLAPTPLLGGWRREMVASAGGLTVNMLLWPVFAAALYACGMDWDALVFNPFMPSRVLAGIGSVWTAGLWWLYFVNAWMVGLHVLVPMLPMDAGRVLECGLRARMSARRATWMASRVGLVVALALFVGAMSGAQTRLMGLAVFGAAVCWLQMRRVQFVHNPLRPESGLIEEPANDYSAVAMRVLESEPELGLRDFDDGIAEGTGLDDTATDLSNADLAAMVGGETISEIMPRPEPTQGGKQEGAGSDQARKPSSEKRSARDADSTLAAASMDAVLDSVLAKISRSGMESLNADERAILADATRRRVRGRRGDGQGNGDPEPPLR